MKEDSVADIWTAEGEGGSLLNYHWPKFRYDTKIKTTHGHIHCRLSLHAASSGVHMAGKTEGTWQLS
jgi:hypothetical protein